MKSHAASQHLLLFLYFTCLLTLDVDTYLRRNESQRKTGVRKGRRKGRERQKIRYKTKCVEWSCVNQRRGHKVGKKMKILGMEFVCPSNSGALQLNLSLRISTGR